MRTAKEIQNTLAYYKGELKEKYGIETLGIFGSYIRDEQKQTSDVDILVQISETTKVTLLDFIHAENYLSDLLGIKVDLIEKDTLKPRVGKSILKEVYYI